MEEVTITYSYESESTRNDFESVILSSKEDFEESLPVPEPIVNVEDDSLKIHLPATLPLPFGIEERKNEVVFVDPASGEGKRILADSATETSELFAVLRQFVSPVCDNVGVIVNEMLSRNVGVNDVDSTTGMTMLHYVVKAECAANDKLGPAEALSTLLFCGADPSQRTLLTDLNALHLAAFFDCSLSLEMMANNNSSNYDFEQLVNSLSSEFDFGTPLHIAAANLSVNAAEMLIKHGADLHLQDDLGRLPQDCIPIRISTTSERKKAEKIRMLFKTGNITSVNPVRNSYDPALKRLKEEPQSKFTPEVAKVTITRTGEFSVGDYVLVGGSKRGIIRFIGATKFAPGIWCGIELDDHIGKNDGSINGVRYFSCQSTKGVFAPSSKLSLVSPNRTLINGTTHKKQDTIRQPPIHSCLRNNSRDSSPPSSDSRLQVGITVQIDHLQEMGRIRFIGETDFAGGIWVGLSLRHPVGKNNGTVQGKQYFKCKQGYGIMIRPSRISVDGVNGTFLL